MTMTPWEQRAYSQASRRPVSVAAGIQGFFGNFDPKPRSKFDPRPGGEVLVRSVTRKIGRFDVKSETSAHAIRAGTQQVPVYGVAIISLSDYGTELRYRIMRQVTLREVEAALVELEELVRKIPQNVSTTELYHIIYKEPERSEAVRSGRVKLLNLTPEQEEERYEGVLYGEPLPRVGKQPKYKTPSLEPRPRYPQRASTPPEKITLGREYTQPQRRSLTKKTPAVRAPLVSESELQKHFSRFLALRSRVMAQTQTRDEYDEYSALRTFFNEHGITVVTMPNGGVTMVRRP